MRCVITNKAYIGAMDQRRQTTRNYKDRKVIFLDEKDHIIVYGMHEPIINKEQLDKVQETLDSRCVKTSRKNNKLYTFSGMLRCADCNSLMIRNPTFQKGKQYVYYKCRVYNQQILVMSMNRKNWEVYIMYSVTD